MSNIFASVTKAAGSVLDYVVDWSNLLVSGETIASSSWTVASGITKDSDTNDTTTTTIVVSGGTEGQTYNLTNTIVTSDTPARTYVRIVEVTIGYASVVDRLRFLVGDTDTSNEQATDNDYLWAYDQAGESIYIAAAIMCDALAASNASSSMTKIEGLEVRGGDQTNHYIGMARRFRKIAKQSGDGVGIPRAGGISVAAMDTVRANEDRVPPSFRRNLFRNPPRHVGEDLDGEE